MTTMKVIRDKDGNIINIGDWDFRIERRQMTQKVMEKTLDQRGQEIETEVEYPIFEQLEGGREGIDMRPKMHQVMLNPMPEGAYEDTADIITGPDGGLYENGDPRAA